MKIIIIGATTVGTELAEYLVSAGHAVTLVDEPSEKLSAIGNRLDLRVVQGKPSWPSVLKNAGAENTELLVATSPIDEVNITACCVGDSLFRIPRKIARIRAQDYLHERSDLFGAKAIPIDHIISPEHLITNAIIELLELPGAQGVGSFCNNSALIVSSICQEGGQLIGKKIRDFYKFDDKTKIVAIYRENALLKIKEDDVFTIGDEIFFACERSRAMSVMAAFIPINRNIKDIAILGGSHVADELAKHLSDRYNVKYIEPDQSRAIKVSDRLHNTKVEIFNADPTNIEFLKQEHIDRVDKFIAASLTDEANVIASLIVKNLNHSSTLAVVRNQSFLDLTTGGKRHQEIDIVVTPQEPIISALLTNIRQEGVEGVHLFRRGLSEGIELKLSGSRFSSRVIGKKASALNLPEGVTLALLMRNDVLTPIDDNTVFEDGDSIIAYLHDHYQMRKLVKLFRPLSFWIPKW